MHGGWTRPFQVCLLPILTLWSFIIQCYPDYIPLPMSHPDQNIPQNTGTFCATAESQTLTILHLSNSKREANRHKVSKDRIGIEILKKSWDTRENSKGEKSSSLWWVILGSGSVFPRRILGTGSEPISRWQGVFSRQFHIVRVPLLISFFQVCKSNGQNCECPLNVWMTNNANERGACKNCLQRQIKCTAECEGASKF